MSRDFLSSPRGSSADPSGETNLELVRGKFCGSVQRLFPFCFMPPEKGFLLVPANLGLPPFFVPFQVSGWRSNKLPKEEENIV